MSVFASVVDAANFVKTLPAATAPASAWGGIDEAKVGACVDLGLLKVEEFRLAARKIAEAAAALNSANAEAKEKFTPFKMVLDSDGNATAGLPAELLKLYNEKKQLDRMAAAQKAELEKQITAMFVAKGMVPSGKTVVYGYRGGFAYLITDATKQSGSKKAVSFDDLFA